MYWNQIQNKSDALNDLLQAYWQDYSSIDTWQFWVVLILLIAPLILLCMTVDRKRIFEILFFGYTVHILWAYTGIILEDQFYFVHTYFLIPILPFSINMNASVLPVGFLLLYQYCTNNRKNFYLYTLLLSAFFAFGVATAENALGLVTFYKGMNSLYIFIIDVVIVYFAYWFTRLLLKVRNKC